MLTVARLARDGWRFDLRSALIGAIIAWAIAGFIYARREDIKQLAQKLWAPVTRLRSRMQSSQEDRYLLAMQEALSGLLLFDPKDPSAIFQPPAFLAPPPITAETAEKDELPSPLCVPFSNLMDGHTRIVITGGLASGRTTALAMLVWQTQQRAEGRRPYARFPVWIDLAQWKEPVPGDADKSGADKSGADKPADSKSLDTLAQLASQALPNLAPTWLIAHLRKEPSLLLLDNWETLSPNARAQVGRWVADVEQTLHQSLWIIASGQKGYSALVEVGFVPLELVPADDKDIVNKLYAGWATLLKQEPAPPKAAHHALEQARQAGASLLELNLRTVLYLQTQQLPGRPIEVMDHFLDTRFPLLNLGEGQEAVAEQARTLALITISHLAKTHRLEGRALSRQEVYNFIATLLPEDEERPPKLESAVRKLIQESGFIKPQDKAWAPAHYLWEGFLTAWDLVADEIGADLVKTHLYDPTWTLLLEFYAALGDAAPMIQTLLHEATAYDNLGALLRAARWSIIAPETLPWRKTVLKTLAQMFSDPDLDMATRLEIGRALALSAGEEGALAFFLKALRHPETQVRGAALRGIGWTGASREMALLNSALQEGDLEIGRSAIAALADMGTPGAARSLHQALHQADEHLILPIARALANIPEGQELLRDSVDDEDFMLRRAAAHGLELVEQPWAKERLEKMAREDSEWLVRSAAEAALKTLEEREKTKVVALSPPQIDTLDWLIAWAATQGLGLGVGKAAVRMLLRAIVEGDARTKVLGMLTLTYIGTIKHLDILKPLLEDDDPKVRQAAAHAIWHIEQSYHIYQGI